LRRYEADRGVSLPQVEEGGSSAARAAMERKLLGRTYSTQMRRMRAKVIDAEVAAEGHVVRPFAPPFPRRLSLRGRITVGLNAERLGELNTALQTLQFGSAEALESLLPSWHSQLSPSLSCLARAGVPRGGVGRRQRGVRGAPALPQFREAARARRRHPRARRQAAPQARVVPHAGRGLCAPTPRPPQPVRFGAPATGRGSAIAVSDIRYRHV
jgi:hypothetical protein